MFRNTIRQQIFDRDAFGRARAGLSRVCLLAAMLSATAFGSPAKAAITAEGDATYVQVNASTYRYSLDLQNTGTTTIGTVMRLGCRTPSATRTITARDQNPAPSRIMTDRRPMFAQRALQPIARKVAVTPASEHFRAF